MSAVAVFAHYDPQGQVAPHVLRHLAALSTVTDKIVVVSTADLSTAARVAIQEHAQLVERANEGYDFYSWKVGLDSLGGWWRHDHVILANDSVVGPLVPYSDIIDTVASRGAQLWGITASREGEPHLQSYLLGFTGAALQSPLLHAFWHGMNPVSDRAQVIALYERGISRLLWLAGVPWQAYFEPNGRDDRTARRRRTRIARLHSLERHQKYHEQRENSRTTQRNLRIRAAKDAQPYLRKGATYNPMIALWDRSLNGRLPFVKIETLRDDPYRLGAEKMLAACERAHPDAFAGVREYVERTRQDYAQRGRGRLLVKA